MYVPEIDFLTFENLPEILRINAESSCSWSEEVIRSDLRKDSSSETTYIGAFATTAEAPLLGYAVLGREKRAGLLMALVVESLHRRMGIGRQLLVAVSDCALYLNFRRLKLKVRKSNSGAIALYSQMSFIGETVRRGYYSNGEDAIIMSAVLPLRLRNAR